MTAMPFTLRAPSITEPFLFTVRGTLAVPDIEAARNTHNAVAGSDPAVAAARSFGDLSHAVFEPGLPDAPFGELLFIDYWNSPDGIGQFFADPNVQKGGSALFRARDAVVWQAAAGLPRVVLPAPYGRNDRYVGIVRGPVKSREAAATTLSGMLRQQLNTARSRGLLSREFFFKAQMPGETGPAEIIGLDLWFDAEGMQADYADETNYADFAGLFTAAPEMSVWRKPAGSWAEW